jgi:hypothetical protein
MAGGHARGRYKWQHYLPTCHRENDQGKDNAEAVSPRQKEAEQTQHKKQHAGSHQCLELWENI